MIVFLDLDRTIFQTDLFGEVLWRAIHDIYPGLDVEVARSGNGEYFSTVGDMYYHDMDKHLRVLGLNPTEVYEKLQTSELADGRFEFAGANELVASLVNCVDVVVLTFGDDEYQRFKASLCPSLRGIPVVTTLEPKAILLSKISGEGWLIDDKAVGNELPDNFQFVQVSLEGKPVSMDVPWVIFTSLSEAREYLEQALFKTA